VTLLEALPAILPGVDKQAADVIARAFKKRGIKVITGIAVEGIDAGPPATVRYMSGDTSESLEVDKVVVSVGRRPRSEGIGLEGTGVVDDRGWVTSTGQQTAIPGVMRGSAQAPGLRSCRFRGAIVAITSTPWKRERPRWNADKGPVGISSRGGAQRSPAAAIVEATTRHRCNRFGVAKRRSWGESDGLVKIVAGDGRSGAHRGAGRRTHAEGYPARTGRQTPTTSAR
jgi:dihydrolipoamide dehydrogenase